jgi:hypothetical protein
MVKNCSFSGQSIPQCFVKYPQGGCIIWRTLIIFYVCSHVQDMLAIVATACEVWLDVHNYFFIFWKL